MRCKGCEKVIKHSQKGFTWRESGHCPNCFMEKQGLKKAMKISVSIILRGCLSENDKNQNKKLNLGLLKKILLE